VLVLQSFVILIKVISAGTRMKLLHGASMYCRLVKHLGRRMRILSLHKVVTTDDSAVYLCTLRDCKAVPVIVRISVSTTQALASVGGHAQLEQLLPILLIRKERRLSGSAPCCNLGGHEGRKSPDITGYTSSIAGPIWSSMREQNKHVYEQNLKWNYDLSSRRSTRGATAHPHSEETRHHHTRSTLINRVCYYRAVLEQRSHGGASSGTLVL